MYAKYTFHFSILYFYKAINQKFPLSELFKKTLLIFKCYSIFKSVSDLSTVFGFNIYMHDFLQTSL